MIIQFDKFAQNLVESTSFLLGGRIVNIMDKDGCIIASTETHRIGTIHHGAVKVMATGQEVCIYPDEVQMYPGAKEGINMPIIVNNETIGVVGVFGNPDENRDIANLLKAYTETYISQLTYFSTQEIKDDIRAELLRFLIYGETKGQLSISQLADMIGWNENPPYVCIVMSLKMNENRVLRNINLSSAGIHYMDSVEGMKEYCFQYICRNPIVEEYSKKMCLTLKRNVDKKMFSEYIRTIKAYCESPDNLHKQPINFQFIKIRWHTDSIKFMIF